MNVTSGTRLGPYEIVARLGAGGMGEVWSARDTRLDRLVAIKILPAQLAQDAAFRERFDREARAISQLSHPNICTLYDVGEEFLVMELLEGETLADRLTHGAMPMTDVLRYGVQIAEALAKAHRSGIVHRDLKPGNVMITKSGAKLLDFGLAKSSSTVVGVDGATQQKPLTREGTILGTFQYMAPEQLEGQESDARTDIFALGVLLYEMATGHRAFEGKTRTSLIAQIVSAEPKPLRDVQPITPPAFEHVVARCLSKDPEDRWQSAQDIAEELRWAAQPASALPGQVQGRHAVLPWLVAATTAAAAIIAVAFVLRREPVQRVIWSDIAPPRDVRLVSPRDRGGCAISPDGSRIAFIGQDAQNIARIYLRDLAGGEARALPATEGAALPFWSPDSRSLAFFADGKLKRMEIGSTRSTVIAEDVDGRGGAWSQDGTIIFAGSSTSGLSRVRASGGKPEVLTQMTGDQFSHRFPAFLPDGKHFLYLVQGSRDRGVYVGSTEAGSGRRLLDVRESAVFVGDSIVFSREGSLFAQQFDFKTLQLRGEPREIASGLSANESSFGSSGLSASVGGEVVFPGESTGRTTLTWRDRSGATTLALPGERSYSEPSFSPDQKRFAATSDDPPDSLWEVDVERGRARRLNLGEFSSSGGAVWSRDGKRILFASTSGNKPAVVAVPVTGGNVETLVTSPVAIYPETFSPDGSFITLDGPVPGQKEFDLWALSLTDRVIRPFLKSPMNQARSQFSPDGRFVAYTSDETGRPEIFVQSYPPSDGKWQVTYAGGDQAFWRGDGRELFFLAPDGKLMSVAAQLGPSVSFADPVVLFQTRLTPVSMTGLRNQYLVASDGQRFLLLESASSAPTHLTLVQNLPALLEKSP